MSKENVDENEVSQDWPEFQKSVVSRTTWSGDTLDDILRHEPEDSKTIHTFYRSLKTKTLNPDLLLLDAAMRCVRGDARYLPHVGLAIQHGADPNLYVEYPNPKEDGEPLLMHIAAVLWLRAAFTEKETLDAFYIQGKAVGEDISEYDTEKLQKESQRLVRIIIAMLVIGGADLSRTVTTPKYLIARGENPTNFALYYPIFLDPVREFLAGNAVPGHQLWRANLERFNLYHEQRKDLSEVYSSRFLNDKSRKNLFMIALFTDHSPILTLPDVYAAPDILGLLFKFQARKTLMRLFAQWRLNGLVMVPYEFPGSEGPVDGLEQESRIRELINLNLCLEYFNEEVFYQMLENGIQAAVFPHNFVTKVVLDARFYQFIAPVQTQIMNSMLVKMAEYGVVFNSTQLSLIRDFSMTTYNAINDRFNVPVWKNACRPTQSEDPASMNPDILEIARQLNLPLGTKPQEICDRLEELHNVPEQSLLIQLHERQRRIIAVETPKLYVAKSSTASRDKEDEAMFKDQTLSVQEIQEFTLRSTKANPNAETGSDIGSDDQPSVFANQDSLKRKPEDYPEIDRVIYRTNGNYWILTSDSYSELLQTRRNPWVNNDPRVYGELIPEQVLLEIQRKLELINRFGLSTDSGSIERGVTMLFAKSSSRTKEFHQRQTLRRVEYFMQTIESYGMQRDSFEDLTAEDFEKIAKDAIQPEMSLTVLPGAPNLALSDFADLVLWEGTIFNNLAGVVSRIKLPRPEEEEEE